MENYKLLIVDDAFFVRNVIKKAISKNPSDKGYSIDVVGETKNAKDALDFLENSEDCNVDVITVDYNMPPGENGIELIKKIKAKYPNKLILMISEDSSIEEIVRELNVQFLVKPFQDYMLWNKLNELILNKNKYIKVPSIVKEVEEVQVTENKVEIESKPIEVNEPFIVEEIVEDKKEEVKEKTTIEDMVIEEVVTQEPKPVDETLKPKKKKKKKKKKKTPSNQTDVSDLGFEIVGNLNLPKQPVKDIKTPTQVEKEVPHKDDKSNMPEIKPNKPTVIKNLETEKPLSFEDFDIQEKVENVKKDQPTKNKPIEIKEVVEEVKEEVVVEEVENIVEGLDNCQSHNEEPEVIENPIIKTKQDIKVDVQEDDEDFFTIEEDDFEIEDVEDTKSKEEVVVKPIDPLSDISNTDEENDDDNFFFDEYDFEEEIEPLNNDELIENQNPSDFKKDIDLNLDKDEDIFDLIQDDEEDEGVELNDVLEEVQQEQLEEELDDKTGEYDYEYVTFEEEDEDEYIDEELSKSYENMVVTFNEEKQEEPYTLNNDDFELEELIRQASYSLEDKIEVVAINNTPKSTLKLDSHDILDEILNDEKLKDLDKQNKKEVKLSKDEEFEKMLEEFENSDEYKNSGFSGDLNISQDESSHKGFNLDMSKDELLDVQDQSFDLDKELDMVDDKNFDIVQQNEIIQDSNLYNNRENVTNTSLDDLGIDLLYFSFDTPNNQVDVQLEVKQPSSINDEIEDIIENSFEDELIAPPIRNLTSSKIKNQNESGRSDGTSIKQNESFFGKFFKK